MRSTLITMCLISIPIVTGIFIYLLFHRTNYLINESKQISPSFFMILAVLFSLFSNLLATEMWNNISQTNQDIRKEVSNLRSLLRFSETFDDNLALKIREAVYAYKDSAIKNEFVPKNHWLLKIKKCLFTVLYFFFNSSKNT